jgi:MFS family permease
VIITMAEMLVSPTGQAIVANIAPVDMRGRYMAVFGFSWTIPNAIGPLMAGVVMDNYNPNWVWYGAGIFMLVAAAIFALLQVRASDRFTRTDLIKVPPAADTVIS